MSTEIIDLGGGSSTADDLSENGRPENELRPLIYTVLENQGFLNRFKAQIRAAVFNAIERPNVNCSDILINDQIGRAIVLDWLEKNQLHFTLDVFKVESSGPRNPAPIERTKLIERIGLQTTINESQTILGSILERKSEIQFANDELPDSIRKSIDQNLNQTSQSDSKAFRDHFHSLFAPHFDKNVLDTFLDENLKEKSNKQQYEQVVLKWIRSCAAAISPNISTSSSTKAERYHENASLVPPIMTPARLPSPDSPDSSDDSSSSSPATDPNKELHQFPLPSPAKNKSIVSMVKQFSTLIGLDNDDDDDDDDDADGSEHNLSERNATDAQRAALRKIEQIANGDETPRVRTTVYPDALKNMGTDPVEYEDESFSVSQSMMSSVDDVTVDKSSPYSTIQLDYVET